MYQRGSEFILRLESSKVFFSGTSFLLANVIKINLAVLREYAPREAPVWVSVRVNTFDKGTLDCTVLEFNPSNRYRFDSQYVDVSDINRLLLGGTDTPRLLRLTDAGTRTKDTGSLGSSPRQSVSAGWTVPQKKVSCIELPTSQVTVEEPEVVYTEEFEFHFYEMRIVDSAAIFKSYFPIPGTFKVIELELRVENDFLRPEFDSIKNYLKNFLKVKSVKVSAMIRCRGATVLSVDAASVEVTSITSDLLDTIKYWYIKRELRATDEKTGLVTVDDLFEKVKGSGLQPADRQFVDDILTVKRLKHAEHMQYLAGLHLCDLMKLQMQKKPFAFVCFVSGMQGCFFVLETLDKADATYLWKLQATEAELRQNVRRIRDAFLPVEQDISLIRDQGRNPYRNNPPANFFFVRHDYTSSDGFTAWKIGLHEVLDGEDRFER